MAAWRSRTGDRRSPGRMPEIQASSGLTESSSDLTDEAPSSRVPDVGASVLALLPSMRSNTLCCCGRLLH
jgi:hypothetical protein